LGTSSPRQNCHETEDEWAPRPKADSRCLIQTGATTLHEGVVSWGATDPGRVGEEDTGPMCRGRCSVFLQAVGRHEPEGRRKAPGRKDSGRVPTQRSRDISILIQCHPKGARHDEELGHACNQGNLRAPSCPHEHVRDGWSGHCTALLGPGGPTWCKVLLRPVTWYQAPVSASARDEP
jgi:hypothetical protein